MRGKLAIQIFSVVTPGITPAHAGKTILKIAECGHGEDHPRACGENFFADILKCGIVWITPAHAGKTPIMMLMLDNAMDHPRACGENSLLDKNSALSIGSPPRMRGKPRFTHKIVGNGRITPAHAGKTNVENSKLCNHRDHPRACGENYLYQQGQPAPEGSPPRMRGKPIGVSM